MRPARSAFDLQDLSSFDPKPLRGRKKTGFAGRMRVCPAKKAAKNQYSTKPGTKQPVVKKIFCFPYKKFLGDKNLFLRKGIYPYKKGICPKGEKPEGQEETGMEEGRKRQRHREAGRWIAGGLASVSVAGLTLLWASMEKGWHAALVIGCGLLALYLIGKKTVKSCKI